MSSSLLTKRALADSLKTLMTTTSLTKITVNNIVDSCGLNRQTFYYHFQDKYKLVNWIYQTEAVESIAGFVDYQNWTKGIARVFEYLLKNKLFYLNALSTPEQEAFDSYLFRATHGLILGVVREVGGDLQIDESDLCFVADFYAFAFVGLAVRWIRDGMQEAPEIVTERIGKIVKGSMRAALQNLGTKASLFSSRK